MLDFFKGKITPTDWMFTGGIIAVTVLLCAAFYAVVFTQQQKRLLKANADVAAIEKNLTTAYDIKQNAKALETAVKKMDDLVTRFQNRLPDEREIPQLVRKFEGLGDTLGLKVELSSLPTITDINKETIPYKVTAHGDFHQIVGFINLLERDERYLKVSDIDINEQNDAAVSQCTFTLSTFRFIQTAPPAPENPSAKAGEKK
jgi:Tfp pilus assembly protein PilO